MSFPSLRPSFPSRSWPARSQRPVLGSGHGTIGLASALALVALFGLAACDDPASGLVIGVPDTAVKNVIPTTNNSSLEVRIRHPENGASVSGTVSIEVEVKEKDAARARGEIFIGDELVASSTSERFTYSWSTEGYSGSQTITAVG